MFEFTQSTFFWTVINFVVLLFLIHKYALPPFYRILEEREKKREDLEAELTKNTLQSKKTLDEYNQQLGQIQDQAKEILKSAEQEKEQIKKEIFAKALEEKQKILNTIKDELNIEKKKFLSEMQDKAANLIIECSEKIMQKELNPKAHYDLINQNINDLEKLLKV